MELNGDFWILLAANLPIVAVIFIALQRGWVVMGVNHKIEIEAKDKDIEFREKLRQEAILDKTAIQNQASAHPAGPLSFSPT